MSEVEIEVRGLEKTQKKMEQVVRDLKGTRVLNAMRQATLIVQRSARINAPVDTGRLRASITPQIVTRDNVLTGVIGSNVYYAPFQEVGTRFMRGKRYLQRALEDNMAKIKKLFEQTVARIVKE